MVRALRSINSRASGRRPQRALARPYVARRGGADGQNMRVVPGTLVNGAPPRQPPRIPRRHDEIAARKQLRIVRVVMARARPKQLANINNRDELIGSVDDTNGPIQRGHDRMLPSGATLKVHGSRSFGTVNALVKRTSGFAWSSILTYW